MTQKKRVIRTQKMICHGSGDLLNDGCCYVAGKVCPLRWKIVDNTVLDADGNSLGSKEDLASTFPEEQRETVVSLLQGVTFACSVATKIQASAPECITSHKQFEEAWDNDPEYVRYVRPAWEIVERNLGLDSGAYNCSTWAGDSQCCFAETAEENETKARCLSDEGRIARTWDDT